MVFDFDFVRRTVDDRSKPNFLCVVCLYYRGFDMFERFRLIKYFGLLVDLFIACVASGLLAFKLHGGELTIMQSLILSASLPYTVVVIMCLLTGR